MDRDGDNCESVSASASEGKITFDFQKLTACYRQLRSSNGSYTDMTEL